MSLCEFNQVPIFTSYSFEDNNFVKQFASILVEGASVLALGSQALLEKGREFSTTDSGIEWSPPKISELLDSQYSQLYVMHWNKLKYIKKYIKDFEK
jgi:imidazoleglycerol phosphate synthase glutamine amidotransferase subunit HisH